MSTNVWDKRKIKVKEISWHSFALYFIIYNELNESNEMRAAIVMLK